MTNNKKGINIIILVLLLLFSGFIALRFSAALGIAVLGLLALGVIIGGGYYLFHSLQRFWRQYKQNKSMEGSIFNRQRHCRQQIERLELEVQDIYLNILELKAQLSPSFDIPISTRQETARLVKAFQKESDLRKTKIVFYRTCLEKLQALLHNHQLTKKLEIKQYKLKQLQEKNYEELGKMEQFKSNLEQDQYYLETIETLTLRMLKSGTLDTAEELRLELVEMTKDLDRI